MKPLQALYKLIRSFFKTNWDFDDYPLITWKNRNACRPDAAIRAGFFNWPGLAGFGESKQKAIDKLKESFHLYKESNEKLPRPGTKVPLRYASTERIEKLERVAVDFFNNIIGINYYNCFISDLSSLYDFNLFNNTTIRKIKEVYGVDVDDDGFIVDVLEKIENTNI